MKKLFISCPMKGRTTENIKESMEKLHKIAEIMVGEELEVIDTYVKGDEYKDCPIRCLGESIKRMQDADYFIGPRDYYDWNGCYLEREVAIRYGVRVLELAAYSMMPDAVEVIQKRYDELAATPTLRG